LIASKLPSGWISPACFHQSPRIRSACSFVNPQAAARQGDATLRLAMCSHDSMPLCEFVPSKDAPVRAPSHFREYPPKQRSAGVQLHRLVKEDIAYSSCAVGGQEGYTKNFALEPPCITRTARWRAIDGAQSKISNGPCIAGACAPPTQRAKAGTAQSCELCCSEPASCARPAGRGRQGPRGSGRLEQFCQTTSSPARSKIFCRFLLSLQQHTGAETPASL